MFGSCSVRIWVGELAILVEGFPDFLQFLQINSGIIPQLSRERPPPQVVSNSAYHPTLYRLDTESVIK
jgi:hypothetical protein